MPASRYRRSRRSTGYEYGRLPAAANLDDETGDSRDDDSGDFKEREPEFQSLNTFYAHQVYGVK